jgi:hypothetical protein
MREKLDREVRRWVEFIQPVSTTFSIKEIIQDQEHTHRHTSGLWHLYSFWMIDNTPLKIGVAGPKSAARYNSQHYNSGSANSNLAKPLTHSGMCEEPAKDWIISNTYRINAVFTNFSKPLAHALETHLHVVFQPRFEK